MLHHQSGASVADNTQDPLNQWSWFQTTLETARRKEETVRNSSDINSSVLSPPIVAPTSSFSVSIFQAFYIELSPTKQSVFVFHLLARPQLFFPSSLSFCSICSRYNGGFINRDEGFTNGFSRREARNLNFRGGRKGG